MKKIFDYTAQELWAMLNDSDESSWLEVKGQADIAPNGKENFRSLMESVCSFSNEIGLGGGIIIYGIGENKLSGGARYIVEGIPDPDKAQLDIATQCKTIFNIPVYPQMRVEKLHSQNILLIFLSELSDRQKPIYFKKEGLPA